MRYALIENNQVKDIFVEPEGFSIEECFHPDIVSLYIPCPDNIIEGDLYDPEIQKFVESPDRKLPNYSQWIIKLSEKKSKLGDYRSSLTPIINNLTMNITKLDEYKGKLSLVLSGVDDYVEVDGQLFSGDDFKLMIEALKNYESEKNSCMGIHLENIKSFNNAENIENYDYTTGWPETNISI